MSWVALNSATKNSAASVHQKKLGVGITAAATTSEPVISTCIAIVHERLVKFRSTSGPQNSLNVHGKPMMLVQKVIFRLSTPRSL
jgi:hypothetical protein